jgi:uncharacterized membrane protein
VILALPSLPSWEAAHPAVSHFPIALFFLVPVLLLVGLLRRARREELLWLAFAALAAATVGVYLSAASGDAARDVASKAPPIATAIAEHEELGSLVRALLSGLTVLFAAFLVGPRLLRRKLAPAVSGVVAWLILVLSVAALVPLWSAAHSGAVLVHRLGVHAKL